MSVAIMAQYADIIQTCISTRLSRLCQAEILMRRARRGDAATSMEVMVWALPMGEFEVVICTMGHRLDSKVTFTIPELGIFATDSVSRRPPEPGFSRPVRGVTDKIFDPTYSKFSLCEYMYVSYLRTL